MEVDIPDYIVNARALIKDWNATNPKKKYDSKAYNRKFYISNKDKVSEKHICELCKGSYTYFNISAHKKTQKHLKCITTMNDSIIASEI